MISVLMMKVYLHLTYSKPKLDGTSRNCKRFMFIFVVDTFEECLIKCLICIVLEPNQK